MIANDRAQISQAHVQVGLCLCCLLLWNILRVLKHFVDVHNYFVFVFVRFLLYVVYVFALCSPYLEDNKVSIHLNALYVTCICFGMHVIIVVTDHQFVTDTWLYSPIRRLFGMRVIIFAIETSFCDLHANILANVMSFLWHACDCICYWGVIYVSCPEYFHHWNASSCHFILVQCNN